MEKANPINPQIYFGPAGWSYPDWNGTVYPKPKPKSFNPLAFLAQSFEFVEVNTSFYRIPSPKMTQGWVKKTESAQSFQFWVKIFQNFTHHRLMPDSEVNAFKVCLQPLTQAKKLMGLLAQFPYSFKLNPENLLFLQYLGEKFPEYPLAIEFRHQSWINDEVLNLFQENRWIWVNIDQPIISASLPLTAILTHPSITYFRLHGRNYQDWFSGEGRDARYHYDYQFKELQQIADKIRELKAQAKSIFISGNNHYKGNAIKNLLELKKILSE